MYYLYGGDCPECGASPRDGFESEATWTEVTFTCPECDETVSIDFEGSWGCYD